MRHDDISDAHVVCRQLAFSSAVGTTVRDLTKAEGIWLDDLRCQGGETLFSSYPHLCWGNLDCGHDKDARVICATKLSRKSMSVSLNLSTLKKV